ncbi:hypothetical protein EW146_g5349 [Bondarzewia mesenterica]|uniref:Uncharacterized protein n=1 Tax=Bondarzewia mesenterica TaxID=1095465 RepID=A0A4S4LRV8_9AGAM|nr:hypothetical protein EW146_g5349 [Bondarzewia mesenterica]
MPAAQATTPDALEAIYSVLLAQEWEALEWLALDNNIIGFGGLESNNTGLQMNVSSENLDGDLAETISSLQGGFHVDVNDFLDWWTLMTMVLRLPPDSDPGPFLLAHPGLYIREASISILWVMFKGNDLHLAFRQL